MHDKDQVMSLGDNTPQKSKGKRRKETAPCWPIVKRLKNDAQVTFKKHTAPLFWEAKTDVGAQWLVTPVS